MIDKLNIKGFSTVEECLMSQEKFSAIVEKYKDECYEKYSRS